MGGLGGADAWGLLPLDSREQICCGPLLSTHTHVHGHGSRTHPDSQAWRPVDFLLSEHWKGTSDSSVFAFAPPVGPGKAGTWLYSCGSFEPCQFQRPACPPGTREPTNPGGGATQEDLVPGSQRVYQRSACRSCFVGTECSRPLRRGPGPARGAQGLLGWGLHSGCPFALPLNSLHFSHEQTVRA